MSGVGVMVQTLLLILCLAIIGAAVLLFLAAADRAWQERKRERRRHLDERAQVEECFAVSGFADDDVELWRRAS